MRSIFAALAIFLAFGAFAQQKTGYKDEFGVYSNKYAQEVVGFMTQKKLKGREAGTRENAKVMAYIAGEFAAAGCDVRLQGVDAEGLAQAIGAPKPGKTYPKYITNVIASVKGRDTSKIVVVGAHYDHLGYRKGVGIHYGADDNASGIVALLSLAKMIKASGTVPEHTILFCAWDAEEKGLLGSKYFVQRWYANRSGADSICRYMNFDMVGRTADPSNPAVTYAWNDNYPFLKVECENALNDIVQPFNVIYDRRLGDGKGGSDYAPFSAHNIPYVAWMEDIMHEDYHKPTDTPDKIHWIKLRKTVLLAYAILWGWVN